MQIAAFTFVLCFVQFFPSLVSAAALPHGAPFFDSRTLAGRVKRLTNPGLSTTNVSLFSAPCYVNCLASANSSSPAECRNSDDGCFCSTPSVTTAFFNCLQSTCNDRTEVEGVFNFVLELCDADSGDGLGNFPARGAFSKFAATLNATSNLVSKTASGSTPTRVRGRPLAIFLGGMVASIIGASLSV